MQIEKVYEPQRFEPHWAQWWIDQALYRADIRPGRPYFRSSFPPPNVTGSLHIGHMLDHTEIDVTVRWHRMSGETPWLPGTDHAGIATQMVVERQLAQEGLPRVSLGREEFERRVWQWKDEVWRHHQAADVRRAARAATGPANDSPWIRACPAPCARRSSACAKGLIYRGDYMVNWCPGCHTAISDLETVHEATPGHLWHIRYPVIGADENARASRPRARRPCWAIPRSRSTRRTRAIATCMARQSGCR